MKYGDFRGMTLKELEVKTSIADTEWSRYFNDSRGLNEATIHKAARGLGMTPTRMFNFILRRRLETLVNRENRKKKAEEVGGILGNSTTRLKRKLTLI
jgi:transcriptional regulator with XRE-family HTH domain